MSVPVFVYGSSGMLAGELLRLVEGHPELELRAALSRSGGQALRDLHPFLSSGGETVSVEDGLAELARSEPGLIVLGLPHGESAPAFLGLRDRLGDALDRHVVVDLSADFRLRARERYERAYGREHPAPELCATFRYALPELDPDGFEGARRLAAPGCFATALQLAALPAARAGLLSTDAAWHFFAVTGSSGSGNAPKPGTHHPHRSGNLWAYGLAGHRHEAELEQALERVGSRARLHFVPHSGPFVRGIHLTAALPLGRPVPADEARAVYAAAFEGQPFVEIVDAGVPDLRRVVGSNRASLGLSVRGEVLNVLVCLDNLIKGGAGQGLQAANLALGWPQDTGLPRAGLGAIG